MRVALGLKARTGRAIVVVLGGSVDAPVFVERAAFMTVRAGEMAAYHEAEGLAPAAARKSVERSIAAAHEMAEQGIRDAMQRIAKAGHEVIGASVLVGPGRPPWSTDEILAVHVRMHQAEGELFRDVLAAGARACKLPVKTLSEKTALDAAARSLGWPRARLDGVIVALGRAAGPPWGKDQKEAAAAALAALA